MLHGPILCLSYSRYSLPSGRIQIPRRTHLIRSNPPKTPSPWTHTKRCYICQYPLQSNVTKSQAQIAQHNPSARGLTNTIYKEAVWLRQYMNGAWRRGCRADPRDISATEWVLTSGYILTNHSPNHHRLWGSGQERYSVSSESESGLA